MLLHTTSPSLSDYWASCVGHKRPQALSRQLKAVDGPSVSDPAREFGSRGTVIHSWGPSPCAATKEKKVYRVRGPIKLKRRAPAIEAIGIKHTQRSGQLGEPQVCKTHAYMMYRLEAVRSFIRIYTSSSTRPLCSQPLQTLRQSFPLPAKRTNSQLQPSPSAMPLSPPLSRPHY